MANLYTELQNLLLDSTEYSHPCDGDEQRFDRAHGRLSIHDVNDLLAKHAPKFRGVEGWERFEKIIPETVLCDEHFEYHIHRHDAEWRATDKFGNSITKGGKASLDIVWAVLPYTPYNVCFVCRGEDSTSN